MEWKVIRVLQVTHTLNRGGTETMLMNYYRCIDKTKLQFDFLLTTPLSYKCDYEDEVIEMGGKIFHLPGLAPFSPWRYLKSLSVLFKNHPEYKIVHSHISATSVFPLYIAKRNNVPVRIVHSHNTHGGNPSKHFITIVLKLFLRYVGTHFLACGTDAAEWLYGKRFFRNNDVFILKNAIQASLYSYNEEKRSLLRAKEGWSNGFVIGHIGRFTYQKNHGFLLDIFKNIKLLYPHALLLLVGDGEEREVIEKKISVEQLDRSVFLTGVVDNVSDYTQVMDVFLFPSLFEGLSLALIEAQAAGLPCFTSETVSQESAVTDLVEFIPLSRGAEYWANKIIRYKERYVRRNTYNEIRKAFYDVQQNTKWLENYYMEICDSTGKL
jgi:glycosyltransferase involved in cell wall biosynthesis